MSDPTRILVVDDDGAFREQFSKVLRREGCEVWAASAGSQGLATTREKRPELALELLHLRPGRQPAALERRHDFLNLLSADARFVEGNFHGT